MLKDLIRRATKKKKNKKKEKKKKKKKKMLIKTIINAVLVPPHMFCYINSIRRKCCTFRVLENLIDLFYL